MEVKTRLKDATIARNEQGDRVIKIKFSYDVFLIQKIRSIIGRRYHKEDDCWSAPLYGETLETLLSWGFTLNEKLTDFLRESKNQTFEDIEIPGLKGTLLKFQEIAVSFTEAKGGRILNADEMGLGKTIDSLAWLQLHRKRVPVVIICPASAKLNWERETNIWLPNPKTEILTGEHPWKPTGEILIINYDIISYWGLTLKHLNPQVLILDEVHFIKTNGAKRTKAVKRLAKEIPYVLALSGTPIENRPVEIYNAWQIIDPLHCPTFLEFTERYCGRKFNGFSWDVSGADHMGELHRRLTETIMLRRKKIDVLPDLPAKVGSFVPLYLHNWDVYKEAEADVIAFIQETKGDAAAERASRATAMVKFEILKQLAVRGKLQEAIDWIKDFLEVENKLVVFAVHTFVIDALMEIFPDAVRFDGSVSAKKKQQAIDTFQNDPNCHLFVGQIKAAGVAITLTAASNVAFLEFPWTPGTLDQAIDRVHRIGQLDSVTAYYLMAKGTVEENIAMILDTKRKVISAVTDGIEVETSSLLSELMKIYSIN